jgi:hypothetical protein
MKMERTHLLFWATRFVLIIHHHPPQYPQLTLFAWGEHWGTLEKSVHTDIKQNHGSGG